MDDKVPIWHQKDGIGKMYNIIEDNVTWRSTNYTRNVTTKDKLINDRRMVQQGWITQWFKRGTNEINNYQIKNGTIAWHDAMFTVKRVV